jgi:hypothetical protein
LLARVFAGSRAKVSRLKDYILEQNSV